MWKWAYIGLNVGKDCGKCQKRAMPQHMAGLYRRGPCTGCGACQHCKNTGTKRTVCILETRCYTVDCTYNDVDTTSCNEARGAYGYYGTKNSQRSHAKRKKPGPAHDAGGRGLGTAEIDLIHAVRHHPGCTQAQLAELLHADKAAIARRTKNSGSKGSSDPQRCPQRPAQPAAVPHQKGRKA